MQDIGASINRYQKYARYSPMIALIRLAVDSMHPFAREAEALMAGYSAAGSG